jgi:RNA polymerase sigma-70 factor (ECF subfamily)
LSNRIGPSAGGRGGVRENARGIDLQEKIDVSTFDRVYESYADRVLNLAYRMTGSEETARDLTQDIFLKVYDNLDTFEHRSNVYTWIYRIAVNHIYNHLKRERRRTWVDLLDSSMREIVREDQVEPTYSAATSPPPADRKLEEGERADVVWRAVRSLPPKYQLPITLYHYEGLSYKDIAEATGLSMSAVETRIHRGRKKLIKLLEPWIDKI